MMYAYVTCRPDVGYAITMMSFSTKLSSTHYHLLKGISKNLRLTKDWGIKVKYIVECDELNEAKFRSEIILDKNLLMFPVDINQPILMAFVDAAYANDQQKRQSTPGFIFTYCGGAIVHRSKTQTVTAVGSTEAEFLVAVLCTKISLYLRSILSELGFPC